MSLAKRIKEQLKKNTVKIKELPNEFYNRMAVYCIDNELHMRTIYTLCKIKHVDQMLNTMRDELIVEYNLHAPTIDKLADSELRNKTNVLLKDMRLTIPKF